MGLLGKSMWGGGTTVQSGREVTRPLLTRHEKEGVVKKTTKPLGNKMALRKLGHPAPCKLSDDDLH